MRMRRQTAAVAFSARAQLLNGRLAFTLAALASVAPIWSQFASASAHAHTHRLESMCGTMSQELKRWRSRRRSDDCADERASER